jgi:hypothetical protein
MAAESDIQERYVLYGVVRGRQEIRDIVRAAAPYRYDLKTNVCLLQYFIRDMASHIERRCFYI